jgi:hypothetical protein
MSSAQKIFTGTVAIALAVIGLVSISCDFNHGIAPLPGKIRATIYFYGEPPENTEGIYMTVTPTFPPHAINELYQSPNSLPIHEDTVVTEMELPYGHYDAMSLWFYSEDTKSNLADILSIPLNSQTLYPIDFNITEENPVVEMEMFANWATVDKNAAIEGTVTFNGPFPKNTLATAVAAYLYEPTEGIHYLVWLKAIDFSIETNPYKYRLPVRNGTVSYIAVLWLPERADLTAFRTLGVYQDPNNPGTPGKLRLKKGETKTGIDIYADWDNADE